MLPVATVLSPISPLNILIKQFSVRHNLTQKALDDLLQLLRLCSHDPSSIPASVYKLNKDFNKLQFPLKHHYFCNSCFQLLSDSRVANCTNIACRASLANNGTISSFIELSLEAQLVNILERKHVHYVMPTPVLYSIIPRCQLLE